VEILATIATAATSYADRGWLFASSKRNRAICDFPQVMLFLN